MSTTAQLWHRRAGEPLFSRRFLRRTVTISTLLFAGIIGLSVPLPDVHASSTLSRPDSASACNISAGWFTVTTGRSVDRLELFGNLVRKNSVVLLGESHASVDHHRWQLYTLAALHGRAEKIVIGFEAFPRRLQPVLENWVAGKLSAEAFLKESEWRRVWGFDPALYMPLFQFARLNRIPMIALNVERKLVSRVGKHGWASVPILEREGMSNPAPASLAYQRVLAGIFRLKKTLPAGATAPLPGGAKKGHLELDEKTFAEVLKEPKFKRFVEAQLTWDRAMAEALAAAKRKFSGATIVGIVGSGHMEDGHGVPYQLKDLGVNNVAVLIPISIESACEVVGTSFADAVFTLPPESNKTSKVERPRLGILLENALDVPRINRVIAGSVAETTGLRVGDHVVGAAGMTIQKAADLIDIVARQAPGTWLPLTVRRGKKEIKLIAKFPPRPRQGL